MELPKLINEIVKTISNKKTFVPQFEQTKKRKMRSAEEIMKDYGLGGVKNGQYIQFIWINIYR